MLSRLSSSLRAYLLSPLLVALTTWLLLHLQEFLSAQTGAPVRPFGIGLLISVAAITLLGGREPGLLTLGLSLLSLLFVLTPAPRHLGASEATQVFFMICAAAMIIAGLDALRRNRQLLLDSEDARARLRAVMDTAPVGVLLSDKDGTLTYANQEAERIWGHPLIAVGPEGWGAYRVLDREGRPMRPERSGLARALAGEAPIVHDERIIEQPDGKQVFIITSSARVYDAAGRVRSGLVVMSDITARKESEQQIERLLVRERLINRIGQISMQTLAPEQIQAEAAAGLRAALGADRCWFTLEDEDREERGRDNEARPPILPLKPGQTLMVADAHDPLAPPALRDAYRALQLRSGITTPLFDGRRLVATLNVAMTETAREWTSEEVALTEAIAVQARAATEAVRSQQRERAIAAALQDALIPAVPKPMPGLEMASYYKAALREANVGGDFLDVFSLDKGQVVFTVGDLSGKGLQAAAQVATVRNMLRYSLYRAGRLDQAVSELNDTLVAHDLITGFATLFVGIYDLPTRRLTYVSCGHDPGLLRRAATGEIVLLPSGDTHLSPVLGLMEDGEFSQQSLTLEAGDTLFLCTDGVTEAGRARGEFLGVAGVAEMLRAGPPGEGVEELIARLVSDVREYAQGIQHDDICLLAAIVSKNAGSKDAGSENTPGETF